MNENDLNDIFENDSCPDCEDYRSAFILIMFILGLFLLVMCFELFLDIHSCIKDSHINNNLEFICNQFHETNSCSVVYKNNDVVLLDTYNGYVTMENILE